MKTKHALHRVVEELMRTMDIKDPIERRHFAPVFSKILKQHKAFEDRCDECGRKLTHPASVKKQLGPVCSGAGHHHYK